jgi:hypothetical protein
MEETKIEMSAQRLAISNTRMLTGNQDQGGVSLDTQQTRNK